MRIGRFEVINVERRIKEIYGKDGREAAYAIFRGITKASIPESHKAVKKFIKKWSKEGDN